MHYKEILIEPLYIYQGSNTYIQSISETLRLRVLNLDWVVLHHKQQQNQHNKVHHIYDKGHQYLPNSGDSQLKIHRE